MHEPAKAVIVLALSTAVAVWLMGAALQLRPDTGQLAYGNPLPYLKVRTDSGAVRFWAEDFGDVPYERVRLYANGQLAASGGPGTEAAAKCGVFVNGIGKASVTITATRPDVMFCIGTTCGTSYTFRWRDIVRPIRQIVPVDVFKTPDAPVSQLLGGGRSIVDIYIDYYDNKRFGYTTLNAYVNGTRVASYYRQTTVSTESVPWVVYKKPNATGVYLTRIYKPGGPVIDGNLVLYEFNGTYGFEVVTNPVDGEVGPSECEPLSPTGIAVEVGGFCFTVDFGVAFNEFGRGPLWRFLEYLYSSNGTDARSALKLALNAITDLEYNVPRIVERGNSTVLVYHTYLSRQSGPATLSFKTLSISSLGAAYANAILPIDIKPPPPAAELPPTVQSSQSNQSQSSNQQSPKDLLRNIPRTYIVTEVRNFRYR